MNWFERFLHVVIIVIMFGIALFVMLYANQIAMEVTKFVLGL